MKKGQICEGVIEKIDFPNKGRIQIEDEMVTVKNGIPGQKVRFQICLLYTSCLSERSKGELSQETFR